MEETCKTKILRHKDPLVYTYKSTYETRKKYFDNTYQRWTLPKLLWWPKR